MDDQNATRPLAGPHETFVPDPEDATEQPIGTGASGDPDIDMTQELIVATFADEAAARAAFDELREAEKQEVVLLVDAAVVTRDHVNKLHIKEEHDLRGRSGALF